MRLRDYGGRIITTDGLRTVEMRDPNDNGHSRYQYRRREGKIERRVLAHDGTAFRDTGSPWERLTPEDLIAMAHTRGAYHPILDELEG